MEEFPLNNSFLLCLPEHILEQIFSLLSVKDLRNILPLHSRFNAIVHSNSRMNKRFMLTLNRHLLLKFPSLFKVVLTKLFIFSRKPSKTSKALLKSDRRFTNLQLFGDSFPIIHKKKSEAKILTKILKKIGEHVINCEISLRADLTFTIILMNFLPNLETLEFLQNSEESTKQLKTMVPEFKKLKRLKLEFVSSKVSDESFLIYSQITTLRSAVIMGHKVKLNFKCLSYLLSRQPNLKKLVLQSYDAREFLAYFNRSCYFKLKKLEFSHYEFLEMRDMDNLMDFLRLQQEIRDFTLLLVASSYQSILQMIIDLPKLQKLYLTLDYANRINLTQFRNSKSTLKDLRVNFSDANDLITLIDAFPALQNLELMFYAVPPNFSLLNYKNIQRVTIYLHSMFLKRCNFQIHNLKELKLYNIKGSTEDWGAFFALNPQITTIKLFQCGLSVDKLQAIIGNLQKCKVFICYDVLSKAAINLIKAKLPDLKRFYIWNEEYNITNPLSKNSKLYVDFY